MEYLGFSLTEPSVIECNKIARTEFLSRQVSEYNGMTAPIKVDRTTYKCIITFKYYFEEKEKYFEINSDSNVLIKSQNGRMIFNPANAESIKCVTEMLSEIDLLINQFCSHFPQIKDKIRYLSIPEIYSLSLVVLGGFSI